MSARRRRWVVVGAASALVLAAVATGVGLGLRSDRLTEPSNRCLVSSRGGRYTLDAIQIRLASTIAVIGKRRGLPNHAVTVALATALQESGLRNLHGGHLDSVGLFQQRPSQGWGTVEEILDPRYAATRFYAALEQVEGWADMPVTVAAQRVQRSAVPEGYADHEDQARVMASALTGEVPAGLTCDVGLAAAPTAAGEARLRTAIDDELGPGAVGVPPNSQRGWMVANWLVAHAYGSGIDSVRYADRTWFRRRHAWEPSPAGAAGGVNHAPPHWIGAIYMWGLL
jgi:hypothetical protein